MFIPSHLFVFHSTLCLLIEEQISWCHILHEALYFITPYLPSFPHPLYSPPLLSSLLSSPFTLFLISFHFISSHLISHFYFSPHNSSSPPVTQHQEFILAFEELKVEERKWLDRLREELAKLPENYNPNGFPIGDEKVRGSIDSKAVYFLILFLYLEIQLFFF